MEATLAARSHRVPGAVVLLSICLICLAAAPANAQETRAGVIAAAVEAKASDISPYRPGRIESAMLFAEEQLLERFSPAYEGLYPRYGGLSTGSGLALGLGYRRFLRPDLRIEAGAVGSTRLYRQLELALVSDRQSSGLRGRLDVRYRNYPQERFFGIGPGSVPSDRTSFRLEDLHYTGAVAQAVRPWLTAQGRIGYLDTSIGPGTGRFPPVDERFRPGDMPGLQAAPDFVHLDGGVEVSYLDEPGNPRAGGRHRAGVARYQATASGDRFDFTRVDAESLNLFPFFDKRRIIVLRGLMSTTVPGAGGEVPFYLMPTLGGPETLRGFREYRFRDRSTVVMNLEYRWELFAAMDMALFADAGGVGRHLSDIAFDRLETSYGVGFRLGLRTASILRLDIGTGGGEGTRVFLKFGPVF